MKLIAYILKKARFLIVALLSIAIIFSSANTTDAEDFNQNRLVEDLDYIDVTSMTVSEIQSFLVAKGSILANYSQEGETAAQIIWKASNQNLAWQEMEDDSPGFNPNRQPVSVSPKVILTTLQKEQSFITRTSAGQNVYDAAMGYACPDSGGCNPNYSGFKKQVHWGAWQLRWNYERAQGLGYPDYQVNQAMTFDGQQVTFANRSTASLYRYTPHVYNGNYNFWNLFHNIYLFSTPVFGSKTIAQSTNVRASVGTIVPLSLTLKNSGTSYWSHTGNCAVGLVLDGNFSLVDDKTMKKFAHNWTDSTFVTKIIQNVNPGENANFEFDIKIPWLKEGRYYLAVKPKSGNCSGFSTSTSAWWTIDVENPDATPVSNSKLPSVTPGQIYNMSATYKNTSGVAWSPTVYPMTLKLNGNFEGATLDEMKRFNSGEWVDAYEVVKVDEEVAPGENYTFNFQIRIPRSQKPGVYEFNLIPIQDNFRTLAGDKDTAWKIVVGKYNATKMSTTPNPVNIAAGEEAELKLRIKNTGKTTWHKDAGLSAPVKLAIDPDINPSISQKFIDSSWISDQIIAPIPYDVKPGESAIINFKIKAKSNLDPGRYYFYVRPIAQGYGYFNSESESHWQINVLEPSVVLTNSSKDIVSAEPGKTYTLMATYKNTTTAPLKPNTNQLRLILNNQSRLSGISLMRRFNPGSWISPTHVVGLEEVIDPGESYTFEFEIRVPWNTLPGRYFFDVSPILNGYRDLPLSESANWTIIVPDTKAQKVSQSPHFSAEKGQIYDLSVTLKNTGLVKWSSGTNAFGLELTDEIGGSLANLKEMKRLNYDWISATQVTKIDHDVAPGESYTFNFKIRIPWQITYEKLRFSLRPVLNNYLKLPVDGGVSWMISIK